MERQRGDTDKLEMDLHQLRLSLLKLSPAILAVSSWVFLSFVFAARPTPDESSLMTPAAPAVAGRKIDLTALVRLPASLPARLPEKMPMVFGKSSKPQEKVRMDAVAIACWDKAEQSSGTTNARWVRLTGRNCQSGLTDNVSVRNLTNGYVATVFPLQKQLTTDFIPLEMGSNEILIRFDHEGVTYESRLTLRR